MSESGATWWYDRPRKVFVRGLYPIVEESITEDLVRDLAEEKGAADLPGWAVRVRELARHLLDEVLPEAAA